MIDMLNGTFGASATNIIFALAALAIVILAIIGVLEIIKAMGGKYFGSRKSKQARLSVVDSTPIDRTRRLVLIKRDGVEHLILIGGPTDVLIEKSIGRHYVKHNHSASHDEAEKNEFTAKSDIVKNNENQLQTYKDDDLTANFDNLLDDSELIYEDAPINDHLRLGEEVTEEVSCIIDDEIVNIEPQKAQSKPDIIRNLLSRHRSKAKKSTQKAKELVEAVKEPKPVKINTKQVEKAETVKAQIKQEPVVKIAESAKVLHNPRHEVNIDDDSNTHETHGAPAQKVSKNPPTKAQEQSQNIGGHIQDEPATAQQAARDRIVHEMEGVVETNPKLVEAATRIESKTIADIRAETRQQIMENTAPTVQEAQQPVMQQAPTQPVMRTPVAAPAPMSADVKTEHEATRQAEQRPTLKAQESVTRLYQETEPTKASIYHAPVEKMPMLEPIPTVKDPIIQSSAPQTPASAQMQPQLHMQAQATPAHAPVTAAVTTQATALKIEEEEDYQQETDIQAEEILRDQQQDMSKYDIAHEQARNTIHAARRVPANTEVTKPQSTKSEQAQEQTLRQRPIAPIQYQEVAGERKQQSPIMVEENRGEGLDRDILSISAPLTNHISSDDMHINASLYEMENFAHATVQPSQALELKNDHILTQHSVYYSPVVVSDDFDMTEEYIEPARQTAVAPTPASVVEAQRRRPITASAEAEMRQAPRYTKEVPMQQETYAEMHNRTLDAMPAELNALHAPQLQQEEDLEEDFDSMFEDELRQVVKSDK